MERKQVLEKVNAATEDGKITCPRALAIARETGISPKELGDLLDEMKVKIDACQLGCFPKS
jgi:hypothetical protein